MKFDYLEFKNNKSGDILTLSLAAEDCSNLPLFSSDRPVDAGNDCLISAYGSHDETLIKVLVLNRGCTSKNESF